MHISESPEPCSEWKTIIQKKPKTTKTFSAGLQIYTTIPSLQWRKSKEESCQFWLWVVPFSIEESITIYADIPVASFGIKNRKAIGMKVQRT
jgi:hypothetical protein